VTPVNVILLAGGRGRRLGGPVAKQFQLLAGEPLVVWAARRFRDTRDLTRMIVVAPPDEFARCEGLLAPLGLPLRLAAAGRERQHSVAAGVALLDPDCAIAVVHDAVRPLVGAAAIAACIAAARDTGAAILAVRVADTVKRCAGDRVIETVARADLWLAQTPQAFRADVLRRAHAAAAGVLATDDAGLVERLGLPVAVVPGDASNRKITTREDLAWAEAVLAGSRVPSGLPSA
jgi:2-C-methyl-D-erythritol 4-phosphate cytidylyltransferase